MLDVDYRPDEVAFFAPKLEHTAPVRFRDGVARRTHVEEHATVLEDGCGWIFGEVGFDHRRVFSRDRSVSAAFLEG
jgi:hypothetical protein